MVVDRPCHGPVHTPAQACVARQTCVDDATCMGKKPLQGSHCLGVYQG